MISSPLTVVKVGGSLLADADAVRDVCEALAARREAGDRMLVVASALQGVTDTLEEAAQAVLDARSGGELVDEVAERLRRRHHDVYDALLGGRAAPPICDAVVREVRRLLTGVRLTGELTPRTRAMLLAHGERLSAPILAAGVRAAGADARAVTSEEAGVRAYGSFGAATCDMESTRDGLRGLDHELHDRVLVLTGFYALDDSGEVVLLGRGGTDYSAGVAAAALDARGLELWKDVPGFMSADPRAVPDARLLPQISFAEAAELGSFGARILHPRCLEPLRGRGVDVSLRSIDDVERVGTRIVEHLTDAARSAFVAALVARRGAAVLRVHDASMVDHPGVAGAVLTALTDEGVTVETVASARTTLSVVIADEDVPRALKALRSAARGASHSVQDGTAHVESFLAGSRRTHRFASDPAPRSQRDQHRPARKHVHHGLLGVAGTSAEVEVRRDQALIAVVGDGLAHDASIVTRVLASLDHAAVPVSLVSHGPGDVSVHCAIASADVERATLALHAALFVHGEPRGARR